MGLAFCWSSVGICLVESTLLGSGCLVGQLQVAAMGSPNSTVIANIHMEHFESLAIPTSLTLIKWWLRYVDDFQSVTRKDQVNKFKCTSIP